MKQLVRLAEPALAASVSSPRTGELFGEEGCFAVTSGRRDPLGDPHCPAGT